MSALNSLAFCEVCQEYNFTYKDCGHCKECDECKMKGGSDDN
jgi:hypothetical protein